MALKSGLTLYAYTIPTSGVNQVVQRFDRELEGLTFVTTAPGGCGELRAAIKLSDARIPVAPLALLSRLSLKSPISPLGLPHFTVWQGEVSDPEINITDQGEALLLSGLGYGTAMRDDPKSFSYSAQTISQMVANQLSSRSGILPVIDQDTTGILPRTGSTLSPQYANNNFEEIITNLALLDGDDSWGVWPNVNYNVETQAHADVAGFPTARLEFHARDTTTVSYSCLDPDISSARIITSSERAYNAVKIGYNDPTQSPPVNFAWAYDTRLTYSGASTGTGGSSVPTGQGTHPYRVRIFWRDYSGIQTVTAAQAQAIAQQYLALFQANSNRIEITLKRLRDWYGNEIPLHCAWADHNIYAPSLAIRGTPLASNGPGINQFYIVETRYTEDANGDMNLVLQCDNWVDTVAQQVARLQLEADTQLRQGLRTTGTVQSLGAPLKAKGGGALYTLANGNSVSLPINYGVTLTQLPTSITVSVNSSFNASGVGTGGSDYWGAFLSWTSPLGGFTQVDADVTTVGN